MSSGLGCLCPGTPVSPAVGGEGGWDGAGVMLQDVRPSSPLVHGCPSHTLCLQEPRAPQFPEPSPLALGGVQLPPGVCLWGSPRPGRLLPEPRTPRAPAPLTLGSQLGSRPLVGPELCRPSLSLKSVRTTDPRRRREKDGASRGGWGASPRQGCEPGARVDGAGPSLLASRGACAGSARRGTAPRRPGVTHPGEVIPGVRAGTGPRRTQ